ncbi:type II toxin-antitoxin system RelE/ParE family toxin [Asticcacaulis sp. W401b]|uniref:type II toxin-antitoxin system RelE/ParE family toxin n=1 Tax=Asticcacaulis sp. W401b TaxID=3388666 RepID=UPI003970E23B
MELAFKQSYQFRDWVRALKDPKAKARVLARITAAKAGNFGHCEPVGEGVSEMRIHVGAGYRAYYTRIRDVVCYLLTDGDKSSQKADIKRALKMASELEESLAAEAYAAAQTKGKTQ